MIIERKKIQELKPAPYNPRKSNEKQETQLKKSLEKFGVVEPIIFNKQSGYIVGGHFRVRELKKLGYKEVECVIVDLNHEDEKELNIRLNANTGEWNWEDLANNWDSEQLEDWGLDVPSFDVDEVLEAEEDDFDATPPEEPKTVLGDLFQIGEHRLMCGDSTDSDQVAKLMNGEKADMVFTDPPYGMFLDTDYSKMHSSGGKKYDQVIGDNKDFTPELINTIFACFDYCKEVFIWGADYFIDLIPNYGKDGSWLVWDKRNSEKKMEDNMYSTLQKKVTGNSFELCWSKQKHKRIVYHCFWNGSLGEGEFEERTNAQTVIRNHPTQKPILLFSYMLNDFSRQNNLVADLFLGSGTTMVASHQLNRKCYGMELDPKYCDVIVKRMITLDPILTIKRNGVDVTNDWK